MDKPYLVHINCKAQSYAYTLSGSGIFQLRSGCSFKNGDIHIESNNHHTSSTNLSYTPPMNLSYFSTNSPDFYAKHLKFNKTHINSFNTMNLKQLSTDLENLKRDELFQKSLKTRDSNQNILTFTTITIFIVGILCWTHRTTIVEKLRKPKNPITQPNVTTNAVKETAALMSKRWTRAINARIMNKPFEILSHACNLTRMAHKHRMEIAPI